MVIKAVYLQIALSLYFLGSTYSFANQIDQLPYSDNKKQAASILKLPERGLCAHRGASKTHPENTLSSFRAAVKAGAQMIEFDVFLTKENQMVVLHDANVDRTTNGTGKVSDLTLAEIKKLDAGSWKAPEFSGEQIPTLEEVLSIMPYNIWLNVHLKGDGRLSILVANLIKNQGRLHQTFLACSAVAARQAKEAVPGILICNMERQESAHEYVIGTIKANADFIQLTRSDYPEFTADVKKLKESGIKVNYYGTDAPETIRMLFENGVDFPLVNDIVGLIDIVREQNIKPLQPIFKK